MGTQSFFGQNLVGQEPWALRGVDDARIRSLETSRTTDEAKLALISTVAWAAYTPTLTNVTIGNGALEAWYAVAGKTIHYRGHFDMGGSSAITGSISLSLPVTARDAYYAGAVYMLDSGVQHYGGTLAGQTTTTALIVLSTGAAGISAPFTWGPADRFQWTLTYEAA